MAEAGVDISRQVSRRLEELEGIEPDLVVTVCDHAAEVCPLFPGSTRQIHRSFCDPAKAQGAEGEILEVFRTVRDEIRDFVRGLPEMLSSTRQGANAGGAPAELGTWERDEACDIADFGLFQLRGFEAKSPRTGERHSFTVIDTADWVNVIATTISGEVVLVRQYRHGSERFSLEIPGGMIDEDEDSSAAAARELKEETGFEGDAPLHLGTVEPNPAILSNRCHTYLVRNARRTSAPSPDAGEDIAVLLLPLSEIPERIARGEICHALVVCAFLSYAQWNGRFSLGA
jgi:8-oxo-dGTP pyrophosphatase MutT (NUDIX family)